LFVSFPFFNYFTTKQVRVGLQFIMIVFIALAIYIPAAHGQARLTFIGGSGTPLSTTLQTRVTYTITNTSCAGASAGPYFDFDEVGNVLAGSRTVTGTMTYSINGGALQAITGVESGFVGGNVTANDLSVYGAQPGVASGATVVLSAGTVTTTTNVTAARPANGNYVTFITSASGVRCSSNGVSLAPTAAAISISGKVVTPQELGLTNAFVTLTDMQGNSRTVLTGKFGSFRFTNITAGETYILSVTSKRYTYAPQVITVNEDMTGLSFAPQ
jgi:hypothetical protein